MWHQSVGHLVLELFAQVPEIPSPVVYVQGERHDVHSVRIFHETRQFRLGGLHRGKTDQLLLEQTVFDGMEQYEKVEIVLSRVVVIDACLSNRPGPVRRPVILLSVSNLVRDLLGGRQYVV